jgi:OFA family oxalate/formate antiporter-like MFS transporter
MNKKLYVAIYILFFLTMMMLGSVYTYSIYRPFIENQFQVSITVSGLPYMFSLGFYAISMLITGKLIRKVALKILVLVGAGLLVGSWIGVAFSTNMIMFTFFYGVLMGISVGILYGVALQFVQRYAIYHPGLFVGLMLLAFGLSSVILAPISRLVIDVYSTQTLFLYYALFSGVVTIPLIIIYPLDHHDFHETTSKSIPYLRLLTIFTLSTMIGLMMIGLTNTIGVSYYRFDAVDVALIVSGLALLNALSRPIFGYLLDHLGFKKTAMISIGSIVIASIINSFNLGSSLILFSIGYSMYWFNLGAWLSIMPNYIKKKHGKDMYASLYGKVFLGYGISAILGTLFSSVILDFFGNTLYLYVFIVVLVSILFIFIRKESI